MHIRESLTRAFSSFLAVPTGVIALFLLLAAGTYALDQAGTTWLGAVRDFMESHVFGDAQATSSLLGAIAGGIITVTSITFSLLLLALQQAAGSLTHQVLDQFMRRRLNQLYFGFFVGIALYALITLATVDPPFNPVFGATLALLLTIAALYVLLLLIYSTISQMRPTEIVRAIHDHTLRSRTRQLDLIRRTRRAPCLTAALAIPVVTEHDGFVTGIDLTALETALAQSPAPAEIVFLVPIGAYVAFHDPLAVAHVQHEDHAAPITAAITAAVQIERERRLETDPAYGIDQLETIAWRSISTSQQNPAPGLVTVRNLRDLLARWATDDAEDNAPGADRLPIVYPDDVPTRLLGAFESLAVVASEAMQSQIYAEIARSFALTFDRLPPEQRSRVEDIVLRTLPALGDHVLTAALDAALDALLQTLAAAGRHDTAAALHTAQLALAASIGTLNSRATRVPTTS